jgi:aspartate kinase
MVVQKFGGTSVADPDAVGRLVGIVLTTRQRDQRGPAVVVSAMSGVTDALLSIADDVSRGEVDAALLTLARLRDRHVRAAVELAPSGASLMEEIEGECAQLDRVVRALGILREVSPRTRDALAASGEMLSSRLVAAALQHHGVPSRWVDAREVIVTDTEHTRATPLGTDTDAALRRIVMPLLDAGAVPVLGGFVGATRDGITTTLGRGGSDYSGALVGAGIGAREIEIWTDVDGMLTADPRIVESPRLVPRLPFAEAAELAYFGAKVLHPSTIRPAVERQIPVRILNSRRPDGRGTLIGPTSAADGPPVTALAAKRGVTVIDVTSSRMLMAHGFLRQVFEIFDRFRTAVDVVTTSEVTVSTTVDERRHVEEIAAALGQLGDVTVEGDLALLCAVGDRLRERPEMTTRILALLDGVPLRMVSQAASRRNITVVVRDADLPRAMTRLHQELFG